MYFSKTRIASEKHISATNNEIINLCHTCTHSNTTKNFAVHVCAHPAIFLGWLADNFFELSHRPDQKGVDCCFGFFMHDSRV